MYKVIIVDDEIKVCELIKNCIDWESFGFEIIKIVQTGVEALDIIKQYKPDLVVTDIRMPGLDGIELIKKAREFGRQCHIHCY